MNEALFAPLSYLAQMVKRLPTTQETQVQSLGQEALLEKEMATHSSILAWRIPRAEEPGRLQSMRSQRVGHDWVTSLSFYILICPTFFLTNIWCCRICYFSYDTECEVVSHYDLICIFLMTDLKKNLMFLLPIWVSSFVRFLFKCLVYYKHRLLVFYYWFTVLSYSVKYMHWNIFFKCKVYIFTFLMLYFTLSPTQWTWLWINSRSWWWTGRSGMLQSMASQSQCDWATELNWAELIWMLYLKNRD